MNLDEEKEFEDQSDVKEQEETRTEKKDKDSHWRPENFGVEPDSFRKTESEDMNTNGNRYSDGKPNGRNWFTLILLASLLVFLGVMFFSNSSRVKEVNYSEFKDKVHSGLVSYVEIIGNEIIEFETLESVQVLQNSDLFNTSGINMKYKTRIPYPDYDILSELSKYNVIVKGSQKNITFFELIIQFLPWIIFIFLMFFIMRNASPGQLLQYGKSHAKQFDNQKIKIKFSDVAGQSEAKFELEEIVSFLKNPKSYKEIGAKIPHGVLMVGPPGTGKTLLAKAVAGEAGVPFFHTSGSDFVEMFVGMGAARVRDLFSQGRKYSPCIIFIDEIDAVGRSRGSGLGGGHDEREQTLNQILVEMDGFDTDSGVIVMAATNRADVLDPALLRPGRFDRQVSITLPDIKEREEILKIHVKKIKMDESIDLNKIARATPGASGADLANLVNEAALYATREKRKIVSIVDFEFARDKMVLGVARKSHVMTDEDKRLTAYHEAGHALLFYYLPDLDPLYKVTIIPHGNAGGVTMGLPEKDISYVKKSTLISEIKLSMGGYVAEKLISGQTSTGPSSDIKQATSLARRMVTSWGMSDLGFIDLSENSDQPLFLGREIAQHKDYSEETAKMIDSEINKILKNCMDEVSELISEHKDQLDLIASALLEKETLDDNDIRSLIGLDHIEHKNSDLS